MMFAAIDGQRTALQCATLAAVEMEGRLVGSLLDVKKTFQDFYRFGVINLKTV
jgi:hypothetical protein